MHSIAFAVPHIGSAGSSPAETACVRAEFDRCLGILRQDEPKTDLLLGNPECTFLLPRVFSTGSNLVENSRAAEALLECLCNIDLAYLQFRGGLLGLGGTVVPLYDHPLRYDRTVVWDTTPALYARNYGDCKSLSATRVAEHRYQGFEARPMFRFMPPSQSHDGEYQFHIVLLTNNGHEDPSKIKGMGQNEWAYFKQKPNNVRNSNVGGHVKRGFFRRLFS
jgi:hypothetical protein